MDIETEVCHAWHLVGWPLHEGQEIQWFATKDETGRKRTLGGRIKSLGQLKGALVNAKALGWNFYVQANPSRRTSKVKQSREDVTHWRYITVDVDPVDDPLIPLQEFPQFAHARIFTGRGYQLWVPVLKDDSTVQQVLPDMAYHYEHLNRCFLSYVESLMTDSPGWIIDRSCSDLARVVRCPGSINQKTGKMASVISYPDRVPLKPYHLEAIAKEYTPPDPPVKDVPERRSDISWVLPHLTVLAKEFLFNGVERPGRHAACYHTIKLLHELGVPELVALEWVFLGVAKCRPTDDIDRLISHARRTVRSIYDGVRVH